MATIENNINELIELLGISEELLRTNTILETEIVKHGGKVVYSFNDIIIASEISDESYNELKKNPFIDSIYEIPLKRYGEIDINLIDQLDVSKLPKNISANGSNSNVSSGTSGTTTGTTPVITNTILTLTANTNEWFEYNVTTTGLAPIKIDIIPNIYGPISISGSLIKGFSSKDGNFDIIITATNSVGVDSKILTVQVGEKPKITSDLFRTASRGKLFSYDITSSGTAPKEYSVYGSLPSGLYQNENIITGIPSITGTSEIVMIVENSYGSDSKTLTLTVGGQKPIITSAGVISHEEYTEFTYKITANGDSPMTFNVTGSLPQGIAFYSGDTIGGMPIAPCNIDVTLKATNPYGFNEKKLKIIVSTMPGGGGCFIASARVLSINGYKRIDDIKIGDEMISGQNQINKVTQIREVLLTNTKLYGFDNIEPFVTEDHPISTLNGWGTFNVELFRKNEPKIYNNIIKQQEIIHQINANTLIKKYLNEFKYEKLKDIIIENKNNIKVYNLSLDGDNTYIVEGIVVHNSKGGI